MGGYYFLVIGESQCKIAYFYPYFGINDGSSTATHQTDLHAEDDFNSLAMDGMDEEEEQEEGEEDEGGEAPAADGGGSNGSS